MKTTTSLALALVLCRVCSAQAGSVGSVSWDWGFTITFESKLEPPKPNLTMPGNSGVREPRNLKPGLVRYSTNTKTHEYFGYEMKVETVNSRAGSYRVTFGPLTYTPEELNLEDPRQWTKLPAPVFPPPEVVSLADTIAVDLFESPATGQKVVDYLRIRRDNCDAESGSSNQTVCLSGMLEDARRALADRLTHMETAHTAAAAAIRESQQAWEKYRDSVCAALSSEPKRLQCEIKLTSNRTHDVRELGDLY